MEEKIKESKISINQSALINLEVIQVIKILVRAGNGTDENPSRYVTEYWGLDGIKIFEFDPIS